MDINDWTVGKCNKCGKDAGYYCGDLKRDYEPDDLKCSCGGEIVPVPREEWKAEDYSEIFGNHLEDRNHHWMTQMPNNLLNILKSAGEQPNSRQL